MDARHEPGCQGRDLVPWSRSSAVEDVGSELWGGLAVPLGVCLGILPIGGEQGALVM